MALIYVVEPGPSGGPGAMGALILIEHLRRAGHRVAHLRLRRRGSTQRELFALSGARDAEVASDLPRPDAWFISTLYVRQWLDLPRLFERLLVEPLAVDRSPTDPLVAIGGQSAIAPEPIAPFADVLALGDGEATGALLADWLDEGLGRTEVMERAVGHPGLYSPTRQAPPEALVRLEADSFTPVVVEPGARAGTGRRGTPTVEIARGCASRCAFCPIGWAGGTYREAPPGVMRRTIEQHGGGRINVFAPDYSSVSYSGDADRWLREASCTNRGVDSRLDAAARHLRDGGTPRSFAFGIEGLSERLRLAIGKPLSTEQIVDTMGVLGETDGLRMTRWYLIVGLPGTTQQDRAEFQRLIRRVLAVYPARLDITLTHMQPVPHTPLGYAPASHQPAAAAFAEDLIGRARGWTEQRGKEGRVFVRPPQGPDTHEHDAALQRAPRSAVRYLLNATKSARSSGDWRGRMSKAGVDVDTALGPLHPDGAAPWHHIDVGIPRERLSRAGARYREVMQLDEAWARTGPN